MKARNFVVIVGLIVLLGASTAMAGWFDDFDTTFDQTWTFGNLTGLGGSSSTFTAGIVGDALELEDTTPADSGGAAAGFGFVAESFANTRVYATLNPAGDSDLNGDIGVLLRLNPTLMTGYALTVDYASSVGSIDMSIITAGVPTGLATGSISMADTDSVYIQFDAEGSTLTGKFLDPDTNAILGTLTATDSTYTSGYAGMVANSSVTSSALRGTFDNAGAVPEPTSLVLLSSGGLCAIGCFWRKRRRGKK